MSDSNSDWPTPVWYFCTLQHLSFFFQTTSPSSSSFYVSLNVYEIEINSFCPILFWGCLFKCLSLSVSLSPSHTFMHILEVFLIQGVNGLGLSRDWQRFMDGYMDGWGVGLGWTERGGMTEKTWGDWKHKNTLETNVGAEKWWRDIPLTMQGTSSLQQPIFLH